MKLLFVYLLIITAAGLLFMRADKENARDKMKRIPEKTLLLLAFVGGSIGVFLGMLLFRHKIRRRKFIIGVPIILALQVLLFVLLKMLLQK